MDPRLPLPYSYYGNSKKQKQDREKAMNDHFAATRKKYGTAQEQIEKHGFPTHG